MIVPILDQPVENDYKTNDKNAFLVTILRDNKAAIGGGGGHMALILHDVPKEYLIELLKAVLNCIIYFE